MIATTIPELITNAKEVLDEVGEFPTKVLNWGVMWILLRNAMCGSYSKI